MALRHDLKIHSLFEETPGVLSIYITGDDLQELPAHAGQFFKFRFLARGMWWRVHPVLGLRSAQDAAVRRTECSCRAPPLWR